MKNSVYLILSLLLYVNLFCDVTSRSLPQEQKIETFKPHCPTVEFFLNSTYTKSCILQPRNLECLALDYLGLQWCLKKSQNFDLPEIKNATVFDSQVTKFELSQENSFCKIEKKILINNEPSLLEFFSDPITCMQNCMDPKTGNVKEKKVCSALAWLELKLQSSKVIIKANAESKPEELKKPTGEISNPKPISEKNVETKTKNGKEIVPGETKDSKINNQPDSDGKTSNFQKTENEPVPNEKQLTANQEEVSEKKNDFKLNNENPEPAPNKNDEKPVQETNGNSKIQQGEKIVGNQGIENTESRPETNQKPDINVVKTDKKMEANAGKTGAGQKTEDVKSSTISDNTNDENSPAEDEEMSPLDKDEQFGGVGQQNQEPELPAIKKILSHYPGNNAKEESHIFSYFVAFSLLFVCCYIGYLNKKKILAILLEGRRSRSGRGRRRPSTANYRKLDCNLEEAVTSQCNSNVTNVIY